MLMKSTYVLLSIASLGLLFLEAPRGAWLTSTPERGKVERSQDPAGGATVRRHSHFVFIGGYHGGK